MLLFDTVYNWALIVNGRCQNMQHKVAFNLFTFVVMAPDSKLLHFFD